METDRGRNLGVGDTAPRFAGARHSPAAVLQVPLHRDGSGAFGNDLARGVRLDEDLRELGIELRTRTPLDLESSLVRREAVAIRPQRRHGIESVRDRENSPFERNLRGPRLVG